MRFGAPVDSWRLNHLLREEGLLFATLKEEAAGARPGAGLTEPIGLSASTPRARLFATIAHGYK
jgi:hypothetical protein